MDKILAYIIQSKNTCVASRMAPCIHDVYFPLGQMPFSKDTSDMLAANMLDDSFSHLF